MENQLETLNFATPRPKHRLLDFKALPFLYCQIRKVIQSGLSVVDAYESLALYTDKPLQASAVEADLKGSLFGGREPKIIKSGNHGDRMRASINWIDLIWTTTMEDYIECGETYQCHFQGHVVAISKEDFASLQFHQRMPPGGPPNFRYEDAQKENEVAQSLLNDILQLIRNLPLSECAT